MALFTQKIMSTNRYLLNPGTPEISLNIYDNTHSLIFYNEGAEKVRILFGTQNFGGSNYKTLGQYEYFAVEIGICEVNPSQRSVKIRLDNATNSAYVRIHQLVSAKR